MLQHIKKLGLSMLVALIALGAAAQTDTVELTWNYTPDLVTVFNYDTDGTPTDSLTVTNAAERFIIKMSKVANVPLGDWTTLTNVSALVTNAGVVSIRKSIVFTVEPGQAFFYLVASNQWGLSPFSNVPWKAGAPAGAVDAMLRKR